MLGSRNTGPLLFALLVIACNDSSDSILEPRVLSRALLISGSSLDQPVQLGEFSRPASAKAASNTFSGRLSFPATTADHFELQYDELALAENRGLRELPAMDIAFIQNGQRLVPMQQGPIDGPHPWWEFVLRPGEVWDDAADKGLTRAAIPFALKERNADCIHNGLMTFVFDDLGSMSKIAFQISQQTCQYLKFEMRGLIAATYESGAVVGGDETLLAVAANRASRLPLRSIESVAANYPGADPDQFGSSEEINPTDMSVYGFIIDGVHYTGGCDSRYGKYPYCEELVLPSYSTAKSLVGGLGLMLAEKKFPNIKSTRVSDYVPECAHGWEDVTLEHALDLVTGHYDSPEPHGDEDDVTSLQFFEATDHAGKIQFACNRFPRRVGPGEHWSYQTWATYLAGTVLNQRLKALTGERSDFYDDLIVDELWRPLQLSQLLFTTRRTDDVVAQPFTGYGLTMLPDDVAKLSAFLGASDGKIRGQTVLDRGLFDAIKQRVPDDPGMRAESNMIRYNNGFRAIDVTEFLNCERPVWLTTLSGFGGINIVIMPNDTAYYYFSDGNVHRYFRAVRESHRIRSMC